MNSPGVKRPLSQSSPSADAPNGAKKPCGTPSILHYFAPKQKTPKTGDGTVQGSPGPSRAQQPKASLGSQSPPRAFQAPKPLSTISEQQHASPTVTRGRVNKLAASPSDQKPAFLTANKVLESGPPCTPPRSSLSYLSRPSPGSTGKSPSARASTQQDSGESSLAGTAPPSTHAHLNYKFLQPEYRCDMERRRPDHPDYDEKTLYVPADFLKECTPALRQWWLIKQKNMDAILFFKMGKFYELFNEDAVTGVNHLNLIYMKADDNKPAHAGFPEVSFQKYADLLIKKGFKVLRVEQTETPAMLEERARRECLKSSDRVVMREVCQVTTKGTRMFGIGETVFHSPQNQYLLALTESNKESTEDNTRRQKVFGVCFVDVTIGTVHIGQFEDDNNLSNLNILLAHHTPTEVIHERNGLSTDTQKVIVKTGARIDSLKANKEFWPIKKAICHLKVNRIFSGESGNFEWPSCLKKLFQEGDASTDLMSLEPLEEYKLAMDSFGAIVYYLHSQFIEKQVLACLDIKIYKSPLSWSPNSAGSKSARDCIDFTAPMVMDHIALKNLEIFTNSSGLSNATLFASINHCQTHFGQRLLKNWICSPLCDPKQIDNRLDAVEALMANKNASLMNEIVHMLSQTPDLERYLSKIKNHCFKSESDTRAVMFDGNVYNKAKVNAFVNLMTNFKRLGKFVNSIGPTVKACGSPILRRLLSYTTDDGLYPDYKETLNYFENSFDAQTAQKTGTIIPAAGVNSDFDECETTISNIAAQLDEHLEEQRRALRCPDIEYFGTGKNRYQLQVPEYAVKKVPDGWRLESGRKGFKRYYTPFIDKNFAKLTTYEEQRKRLLDDVLANIFEQFLRKTKLWSAAIECVAVLDVLQSIAKFARSLQANGVSMCRPVFVESTDKPVIQYTDGRHPVLVKLDSNYVSNNLELDHRTLLLSGANMGGKSTLMRQTALLVILAQVGCYVPASSLRLTPVDRIFSRLGASDRLLEGESTFYTELVETSAMLRCASSRSLLLLDELGRGTSTFDGTAIAFAVLKEISANLRCRCLFSTHYHTLTRDFMNSTEVRLAHMACKVERESDDEENSINLDPLKENITFLYKITDGPAARSYGYNVAKLAGIKHSLISEAYSKSKEIELACRVMGSLQAICNGEQQITGDLGPLKKRVIAQIATM